MKGKGFIFACLLLIPDGAANAGSRGSLTNETPAVLEFSQGAGQGELTSDERSHPKGSIGKAGLKYALSGAAATTNNDQFIIDLHAQFRERCRTGGPAYEATISVVPVHDWTIHIGNGNYGLNQWGSSDCNIYLGNHVTSLGWPASAVLGALVISAACLAFTTFLFSESKKNSGKQTAP